MTVFLISLFVGMTLFVGGIGMMLFVGGAAVFAYSIRSRSSRTQIFLYGVLIQLVLVAAFWTLSDLIASLPIVGSLMFEDLQLGMQFSALPISEGAQSLRPVGSIVLLLVLPIVCVGSRLVRATPIATPPTPRRSDWFAFFAGISALVPYVVVKLMRPGHLLAASMSGDARNHFLIVQQARVSSQMANFLSPGDLASPRFPHAVTAVISSANGSSGINNIGDQWAIGGVTWVSISIIAIASALAVERVWTSKSETKIPSSVLPLAIIIGALPSVSYWLYPVLADGFFTLVVGAMLLVTTGAISISVAHDSTTRSQIFIVLVGVYLVTLAYPYLIFSAAALLLVVLKSPYLAWLRRRRHEALSALLLLLLIVGYVGRLAYPKFTESAALVGSVIPRNMSIVGVMALFAVVALLRTGRLVGFAVLVGLLGNAFTVVLIESAPGNEAAGYSYYSTKVILAGAIFGLVFVPALLVDLMETRAQDFSKLRSRARTIRYSALSLAIGLTPLALARVADATPFVPRLVWSGWSTPSPESVVVAPDDWATEPTAYFRFTPNGEGWNVPEDRLMNFWSPAFWSGFEGPYTGLWNWVYLTHVSNETQIICEGVSGGITKVITRDSSLRLDMNTQCPDVAERVRIEVRQ